ncbi:hypothetical protein C8J56DRAFT_897426 [Mycena floridula]|nr:hypothetical protein C8J56DRAFT_897426 [Mycena floridula]
MASPTSSATEMPDSRTEPVVNSQEWLDALLCPLAAQERKEKGIAFFVVPTKALGEQQDSFREAKAQKPGRNLVAELFEGDDIRVAFVSPQMMTGKRMMKQWLLALLRNRLGRPFQPQFPDIELKYVLGVTFLHQVGLNARYFASAFHRKRWNKDLGASEVTEAGTGTSA